MFAYFLGMPQVVRQIIHQYKKLPQTRLKQLLAHKPTVVPSLEHLEKRTEELAPLFATARAGPSGWS